MDPAAPLMCLRCGAQPRMVTSKGKRRRYCSRCEADMSRECRKRRKLRNLAASAPPSHFESLFLLAETCELVGAEAWEEQQTPSEETLTASWRQKTPSEETLTSMPPREDGEGEAGEEGRGESSARNAATASLSSVPPTEIAGACVGGGDLADCATSHQKVARDASQGPASEERMRTPDENVRNAATASLSSVPPTEIAGACVGGGDLADCATSHQKVAWDASQGPTSEERIGTRDWCGIEVQLARLRADTAVLFIELGALMELTDQPCKKRKAAV